MMEYSQTSYKQLLDLVCVIQQIPSPTFSEQEKAAFVVDQFQRDGLDEVHIDDAGNALGKIKGGPGKPLVISAHIDTVHPATMKLSQKSDASRVYGPSIGDNSLGAAALVMIPTLLREQGFTPPGDIWLAGNTGEEGLGDLRGMRALVDQFGAAARAYLVLEGMGLGQIYHRGLGVERYRITARTRGGHSWVDYGKPSAVHHLAAVVAHIVSLTLPRTPRTTLNVGTIQGGTSINTIAAEAHMDLDLRSEEQHTLQAAVTAVRKIVHAAEKEGVSFEMEPIGLRPGGSIPRSHPLVQFAERCLQEEGVVPRPEIASTDANIPLSRGMPAICVGLTLGGGAHTASEYIELNPLRQGIGQLLRLVTGVWDAV